ncbi:MAG: methyl-accepting chemotaxis protein [Mucispirillum sp.]|nr:methyl-accepting chemotaxis protein [Mucispirillum sp.]
MNWILKFKFKTLLIFIMSGFFAMFGSFLIFMSVIYKSTKDLEKVVSNGIEIVAHSSQIAKASDYLTNQAQKYAVTGNKEYYDNYWNEVNNTKRRDVAVEKLTALHVPSEILSLVEQAKRDSDTLIKLEEESFAAVQEGDLKKATEIMYGADYESGKSKIVKGIAEFEMQAKNYSSRLSAESAEITILMVVLCTLLISVLAFSFIVFLVIFFSLLSRVLKTLDDMFVKIADGDMRVKAPLLNGSSEISNAFRSINVFMSNISSILKNVTSSTEEVASSNEQLASTMEELSSTFSEQSRQVGDTAVSLDVINTTVKDAVDSLNQNQTIVDDTVEYAKNGKKQLSELKVSMEKIHNDADSLSNTINTLANSSAEIGNIVTVINDIADQTNLLALNAAIEAARAGEAGRGFAVVADEVRKLAERTQKATSEVTAIVSTLQNEAESASNAMVQEAERVKEGVLNIEETEAVFNSIFSGIDEMKNIMSGINSNMSNEYSTIQSVHNNAQSIAASIEQSNNAVSEVTNTVSHLQKRVEHLKQMLRRFEL